MYHLDTRSNIDQDDIEVVRDDRLPYKPIKGAMWKIERLLARLIKLVSTTVSGYCQISPISLSLSLSLLKTKCSIDEIACNANMILSLMSM